MMKILKRVLKAVGLEGAAGLHIYRPVMNADKWVAWLTECGVPNPVAADQMQLSVFKAEGVVAVVPDPTPWTIKTPTGWFVKDDDGALCFAYYDYGFSDRYWALRDACGCYSSWSSRARIVLAPDIGDFAFTDEMMAKAPGGMVFEGEKTEPMETADVVKTKFELVTPTAEQVAKAPAAMLEAIDKDEDPFAMQILGDIARGRQVTKAEMEAVVAGGFLKQIQEKTEARGHALTKSKDITVVIQQLSEDTLKGYKGDLAKSYVEEKRLVYGIANVSTVAGVLVEDLDGDSFTMDALEEWLHLAMKNQVGVDFEHEGEAHSDLVAGLAFSEDLQKFLGIDLGMEFLLTVTHVPGDSEWELVKKGEWMHSIAGSFYYED